MTAATGHPKSKKVTASQEDYLEAILLEIRQTGSARVRDIAARLDVAAPSVTGSLKTLAGRGLVNHSPYELVTLTDAGRDLAETVAGRHRVLQEFFTRVLGVDPAAAERNACRIEHAVDEDLLAGLRSFVAFVADNPDARKSLAAFKHSRAPRRAPRKRAQPR